MVSTGVRRWIRRSVLIGSRIVVGLGNVLREQDIQRRQSHSGWVVRYPARRGRQEWIQTTEHRQP